VAVVIVPKSTEEPPVFLERFRQATGLPELEVHELPKDRQNVSLSLEAAQILRHLNKLLPKNEAESDRIRSEYLKRAAMPQLNVATGTKIRLPERNRTLLEQWNETENGLLERHATHIYGELQDLRAWPDGGEGRKSVTANEVARLAASQIVELLS